MEVTTEELRLYLGLAEIDADRAALLLEQAASLARSIIDPLPDGAKAVILSMAGRAYANPQGISGETIGPYSVQRPQAGLYMTRDERRTLARLAGRGGAFTVDPTPADATPVPTWPGWAPW
jgi:hypothetical protein